MDNTTDILLNIDMVYNHKKDFFLYLTLLHTAGFKCDMKNRTYLCTNIKNINTTAAAKITGVTAQTVRKYKNLYEDNYQYCGAIAPLPFAVYNRLVNELGNTTAAEKNGIIRLFCYYVCMCWMFQNFSRNKHQITKDLDSTVANVCRRTQWLVEHKFINLKHKHMNFADKEPHPCVYQLFVDEVPPHYVGTTWWVDQLAERDAQSLEEILKEFKNSF